MVVLSFDTYEKFLDYTNKNKSLLFNFYCSDSKSLKKNIQVITYIYKTDIIKHLTKNLEFIFQVIFSFKKITWKIKMKKNISIIFTCSDKEQYEKLLSENCFLLSQINLFLKATILSKYKKDISIILDFSKFEIFLEEYYLTNAFQKALLTQKTKETQYLIPAPAEVRAKIYSNLRNFVNIKTQSIGGGNLRRISIRYKDNKEKEKTSNDRNNSRTSNKSK